ncbi:hypothetical protein DLJ57_07975 [Micromonospora chalcea]|nr:hypothetical protein DLJ57_07975 [Micromonospora chalcea]
MAPVTTHPGACPLDCPDTCVWQLTVSDGVAVGLRGDRDHPFTRGALCGKVNRYLDAVNGPDRLTTPWVRTGPKGAGRVAYRPASWDEAVERVAAGLRASIELHGPESVLPYYFAGTMGLVQGWTMGPRLFAHLGASRLDTTICTAAARAALRSLYGASVGFEPESIVEAELIVLWGANPLVTNLHLWPFVQQARERGVNVQVGYADLTSSARGWIHKTGNAGFIKLVADADQGVLIGATSAGPAGGEVLSALVVAVHAAVPISQLRHMIYAYPTFHRAIEDALRALK